MFLSFPFPLFTSYHHLQEIRRVFLCESMLLNFPKQVIEEGASDQLMDNDVLNLEHEKSTQDERSEENGGN